MCLRALRVLLLTYTSCSLVKTCFYNLTILCSLICVKIRLSSDILVVSIQLSVWFLVLLSAFSFQFGHCSKRPLEYASNPGTFADDRIYFIWSSEFHFHFGSCSKQSPQSHGYGSNPRSFADDQIYLVVRIPLSIRSLWLSAIFTFQNQNVDDV